MIVLAQFFRWNGWLGDLGQRLDRFGQVRLDGDRLSILFRGFVRPSEVLENQAGVIEKLRRAFSGVGEFLVISECGLVVFTLGGNEKAAELTGIPVVRVKFQVYVICALAAGLQGIIISGWLGSAPANMATS